MSGGMNLVRRGLRAALIVCAALLLGTSAAVAQTSEGTEFWLGFTPNIGTDGAADSLSLAIASKDGATVTVTATPGKASTDAPFAQTFALGPNESRIVPLPSTLFLERDKKQLVDRGSIHVTASAPISVYGRNLSPYTSDGYLGLPVTVLGTEYTLVSFTGLTVLGGSYLPHAKVIATEDATQVTFVSKSLGKTADGTAIPAGGSRMLTLQRGETALFYAEGTWAELSGSRVTSNKPVAVIAGNACSYIPITVPACDHLDEMLPPVTALGQEYIVVPAKRAVPGDLVRVVAVEDDTAVYRDGVRYTTLPKGQMYEFLADAPMQLKVSRPAVVAQFLRGAQIGGYPGDPAEMLAIPTAQFLSSYQIATFQEPPVPPATMASIRFKENYLNVVIPTGALSSLTIDGVAADVSKFYPVPGTNFSWGTISVDLGAHQLNAAVPFGLYAYGLGEYESYAVPGGMAVRTIYDKSDPFPPNVRTVQVGTELHGLATDSSDANANGLLDPDELIWGATIGPRSEDTNMNNRLDAGEDLNGNGRLDRDLGIKSIELALGASNLVLEVAAFAPGDLAVPFVVRRVDPSKDGLGNLLITDLSGNITAVPVGLVSSTTIHNVRIREVLSHTNVDLDLLSFATPPTRFQEFPDRYEIEWFYPVASTLTDIDLGYDVTVKKPQAGETRVVNRELTLDYEDSAGNPVHYAVGPQSVQVLPTMLDVAASLDKTAYLVGENGTLTLDLKNLGLVSHYGNAICYQLRDRAAAPVDNLVTLNSGTLASGATSSLVRPLTLSRYMVGDYDVRIDVYENFCNSGAILKSIVLPFTINDQPGMVAIDSGLRLDRGFYNATDRVLADVVVRNLHPQSLADGYAIRVQIVRSDGTSLPPQTLAVPNLVPRNEWRSTVAFVLQNEAPGMYTTILQLLDVHGSVVDTHSTTFVVRSSADSGFGLTGTLAATPKAVPVHSAVSFDYGLRNQGNSAYAGLPVTLRIADPAAGVLRAEFPFAADIAAGGLKTGTQSWTAEGKEGDLLVAVLAATVAGKEITLAQETITLLKPKVVLTGTVSAAPKTVPAGSPVSVGYRVDNPGPDSYAGLVLKVRIADQLSGSVLTETPVTVDLPAGGSQTGSVSWTTAGKENDALTAVLVAAVAGKDITLAQEPFTLLAPDMGQWLAGTLSANPKEAPLGETVGLAYSIQNQGVLSYVGLPVAVRIAASATGATVAELPMSLDLSSGATQAGNQSWVAQGKAGDGLTALLLATVGGKQVTLAQESITLRAPPINLAFSQSVERASRVLVLAACSGRGEGNEDDHHEHDDGRSDRDHTVTSRPGQPSQASCDHEGDGHDESGDDDHGPKCGLGRAQAIDALLNGLGIAHRVTTDPLVFRSELRSGAYTTYWISGEVKKLKDDLAEEVREAVNRGEALLLDGVHDQRNKVLEEAAGVTVRGKLGSQNQPVWLASPAFDDHLLSTSGRGLKLDLTTGQIAGYFGSPTGKPAVVSSAYGQGKALFLGLDLVASLLADGLWPAETRLGLDGILPPLPATLTPGAYVPLTLTVANAGQDSAVEVRTTLPAGASLLTADPLPVSQADPIVWNFPLPAGGQQVIHLALRAPLAEGNHPVTTEVGTVVGGTYSPYGLPASLDLAVAASSAQLPAVRAQITALVVAKKDREDRDKAAAKVGAAQTALASAKWTTAIDALLSAIDWLTRIDSADTAAARFALDLALKEAQWRWVTTQ